MSPAGAVTLDFTSPSWLARLKTFAWQRNRLTYANFVSRLADLYGDRTAFVLDVPLGGEPDGPRTISYRELDRRVGELGAALRRLGVGVGDRVALITMNRIEMAFVNFALGRIGAIPVPLNFMLRPHEIEHIARMADVRTLVCDTAVFKGSIRSPLAVPSIQTWIGLDGPVAEGPSLLDEVRPGDHARPVEPAGSDELAMMFFTSGTTGTPKGAMLSHASATVALRYLATGFALLPKIGDQLALLVMPVAHVGGYSALVSYMAVGWPTFFISSFDAPSILDTIERHRPTVFTGTPTMYRMLLDAGAAERDLSSFWLFGGGGDAFSDELVAQVRSLPSGHRPRGWRRPWFVRGYGMAETNSHLALTPPVEVGDNCIGWVAPPIRHKVVAEDGSRAKRGEPGELWVRGSTVMSRYCTTDGSDGFEDGWFNTRDTVRRGRWGLLYFVDRSRDIIKSGGFKVAAAEVDNALLSHPAVAFAAAVGIPDDTMGERIVGVVVPNDGATVEPNDVLAWCRARLGLHKCPREIVVRDALPMTFSLKPKRVEVREQELRRRAAAGPTGPAAPTGGVEARRPPTPAELFP